MTRATLEASGYRLLQESRWGRRRSTFDDLNGTALKLSETIATGSSSSRSIFQSLFPEQGDSLDSFDIIVEGNTMFELYEGITNITSGKGIAGLGLDRSLQHLLYAEYDGRKQAQNDVSEN